MYCCKHEGLISSIITSWHQIFIYVIISIIAQEGYLHLLYKVCVQCSVMNCFDHYKLFLKAIYYLWRRYTTLDGYTLLTVAIYYFWRLYITFNGYILLLALPDCDFVRIQDFITISRTYGLKARLDFNINLLALIKFGFFCSSVVSSINFDAPF